MDQRNLTSPVFAALEISAAIMSVKGVATSWLTAMQKIKANAGPLNLEGPRKTPLRMNSIVTVFLGDRVRRSFANGSCQFQTDDWPMTTCFADLLAPKNVEFSLICTPRAGRQNRMHCGAARTIYLF